MVTANKLRVGLYGNNGHQLTYLLSGHPLAEVGAYACFEPGAGVSVASSVRRHDSLQSLAQDDEIDLVAICSPVRADQVDDAVLCLQSGKHVYAEKPCALSEGDLDRVLAASAAAGRHFREMAQAPFDGPYPLIRDIVRRGELGEVVQVFAQKSYPLHAQRPQDERADGGLVLQVGIHAVRWVEQVAGLRFTSLEIIETQAGNPVEQGGLRTAASLQGTLEKGGIATIMLNYLNPRGTGIWGNDQLAIFGTHGMVQSLEAGQKAFCVIGESAPRFLEATSQGRSHADEYFQFLLNGEPMSYGLEEEMHPLRVLLRSQRRFVG